MSNRNRNSSTKSTTRNATNTTSTRSATSTRQTQSTPAPVPQMTVVPTTSSQTNRQTRRARKPVTIRVRATGEEIRRVPVERSGYRVVRYEGRYHTVRGGGHTTPYIVGSEDGEDALGRA